MAPEILIVAGLTHVCISQINTAIRKIKSDVVPVRYSTTTDEGSLLGFHVPWFDFPIDTTATSEYVPPTVSEINFEILDVLPLVKQSPVQHKAYSQVQPIITSSLDFDIEKLDDLTPATRLVRRPRVNKNSPRPIILPSHQSQVNNNEPTQESTPSAQEVLPPIYDTICAIDRRTGSDDMVFRCRLAGCSGTFGRWPDFKRHYDCQHAHDSPSFWCPYPTCTRSEAFGYDPFPRRDKMMDHAFKMHGLVVERVIGKRVRCT